jgi:hypothetical protein
LRELTSDGELDKNDERDLIYMAARLGLKQDDLEDIEKKHVFEEFNPIKKRIQQNWQVTDQDLDAIKCIEKKFDTKLTIEGDFELFRTIYLMEAKGQLPPPLQTVALLGIASAKFVGFVDKGSQEASPRKLTSK